MRKKIATMAVAGGAALALTAPLASTAQAAPASNITRTSACAKFTGNYTYWSVGSWYGYKLTGSITRTCAGSGFHTLWITGDTNSGTGYYQDGGIYYLDYGGQSKDIRPYGESGGVKNIRIALTDSVG
ncbi:hypothetical protein [Streptomyces javensis]|uniref:Streptomyces killer toxin-like beta/gamma crystallin domain-containing protein n=1 Tax=Streptomyces javensis TaxID=114698 RepID=A0ABS0R9N2_9ACTN|nr:hypothetical protein [Streptomyces javensis]MBI0314111.1 hypothetical protein [Streptomyces javensis]